MIEIKRILCPIDFSEFSRHALDYAIAMARWYGSRVFALHVFTNWPVVDVIPSLGIHGMEPLPLKTIDRKALSAELRQFVERHPATDVRIEPVIVEAADVHREIIAQAETLKADLIVIGSHGRSGFEHLLLGSITEKVLRKASRPVMVVPHRVGEAVPYGVRFTRILCAVDFSESSLSALEYAISLAEEADAQLTALHVVEMPAGLYEASAIFEVAEFRLAAEAASRKRLHELIPNSVRTYCEVETVVSQGRISREILRLADERKTDLIVMGVHGRGAVDLMMFGSNTHRVIQAAACPVLTIRGY
jgi:nucleotide-binding universal stress UspA family protein